MNPRVFILAALFCASCHAVAPTPIRTTQASFDGNVQNSGVISSGPAGFLVTSHFLERYDALLATYGAHLVPSRNPGDRDGISLEGAHYRFTAEAFLRFDAMNQLRKANAKP